ncbi:MAG: response regulator [Gammaproteobacteria bacterium]
MTNRGNILYVDDDEDYSELLTIHLQEYNVTADTVESVKAAKQTFDPQTYDAVLTDWHLSDGEGTEVAAHIRSISKNFPILFLSGNRTEAMEKESKKYTPLAFLKKNDMPAEQIANLLATHFQRESEAHKQNAVELGPTGLSKQHGDPSDIVEKIQQRFLHRLQNWITLFEAFTIQLNKVSPDKEELSDIRTRIHKLAGSSQTFGFPELNNYAAQVEHYLNQLMKGTPLKTIYKELINAFQVFLKEARSIVKTELKPDGKGYPVFEKSNGTTKDHDFTLVVADDDELVRDLLKYGLQQAKCKIIQAENGKKVLDILEWIKAHSFADKPDLIVLDVNMPKMTGFEVLETLKSDPEFQTIPIIMLTRRDEDENVIKGISSGALDYITKPFQLSELVNRILSILQRHKTRILVADDDELIRDLLSQRFHRMGYTVLTAKHGNEALARMQAEQPDLTILDMMMPGMDGLAVLKQIKNNPTTADMPVVVLTAKRQQENILQGLESGANDYITKPFDVDEVAARVSGILRRRKTV